MKHKKYVNIGPGGLEVVGYIFISLLFLTLMSNFVAIPAIYMGIVAWAGLGFFCIAEVGKKKLFKIRKKISFEHYGVLAAVIVDFGYALILLSQLGSIGWGSIASSELLMNVGRLLGVYAILVALYLSLTKQR